MSNGVLWHRSQPNRGRLGRGLVPRRRNPLAPRHRSVQRLHRYTQGNRPYTRSLIVDTSTVDSLAQGVQNKQNPLYYFSQSMLSNYFLHKNKKQLETIITLKIANSMMSTSQSVDQLL